MLSPTPMLYEISRCRQQDLLAEAERDRLADLAVRNSRAAVRDRDRRGFVSSPLARLATRVGDQLSALSLTTRVYRLFDSES